MDARDSTRDPDTDEPGKIDHAVAIVGYALLLELAGSHAVFRSSNLTVGIA